MKVHPIFCKKCFYGHNIANSKCTTNSKLYRNSNDNNNDDNNLIIMMIVIIVSNKRNNNKYMGYKSVYSKTVYTNYPSSAGCYEMESKSSLN